jgi:WbqC-like protein family
VTTLLQPGYMPWLGYFDLLQKADVFVHCDDVQFDKHGWRNGTRVKRPKGAIWLTVPVFHSGRGGQLILDVEIDDRQDWRRKHLSTVASCSAHEGLMGRLALPPDLSHEMVSSSLRMSIEC